MACSGEELPFENVSPEVSDEDSDSETIIYREYDLDKDLSDVDIKDGETETIPNDNSETVDIFEDPAIKLYGSLDKHFNKKNVTGDDIILLQAFKLLDAEENPTSNYGVYVQKLIDYQHPNDPSETYGLLKRLLKDISKLSKTARQFKKLLLSDQYL